MRVGFSIFLASILFLGCGALSGQSKPGGGSLASMEHKLQHIESNGATQHPDASPTVFTQEEVNAYFGSGRIVLLNGVQSARFELEPGIVTATTRVDFDFDQLQAGRSSLNPLLAVFTGVHEAVVVAHAHGVGGVGYVHADSVSLDGVDIPRFVLQLFVEKYLQPKYPGVGLDSKFALPDRIDTASVGSHTVQVIQK
jgi:hypothetical protein